MYIDRDSKFQAFEAYLVGMSSFVLHMSLLKVLTMSRFILATKTAYGLLLVTRSKLNSFGRRSGTLYVCTYESHRTLYDSKSRIRGEASFSHKRCVCRHLAAWCIKKPNGKQQPTTRMPTSMTVSNDEQWTTSNINQLLNVTSLLREKRYVLVAVTQAAMRRENGVGE